MSSLDSTVVVKRLSLRHSKARRWSGSQPPNDHTNARIDKRMEQAGCFNLETKRDGFPGADGSDVPLEFLLGKGCGVYYPYFHETVHRVRTRSLGQIGGEQEDRCCERTGVSGGDRVSE